MPLLVDGVDRVRVDVVLGFRLDGVDDVRVDGVDGVCVDAVLGLGVNFVRDGEEEGSGIRIALLASVFLLNSTLSINC